MEKIVLNETIAEMQHWRLDCCVIGEAEEAESLVTCYHSGLACSTPILLHLKILPHASSFCLVSHIDLPLVVDGPRLNRIFKLTLARAKSRLLVRLPRMLQYLRISSASIAGDLVQLDMRVIT